MTATAPIYLDYQSTTPVDPRVIAGMIPYFSERFGNPSSTQHPYGWTGAEAVAEARERVAGLIASKPEEIVFTSCATESNNLAIKGVTQRFAKNGGHLIVSAIEHSSVLAVSRRLELQGFDLTILPVDRKGRVDPKTVVSAIRKSTMLVSIMHANNEIGTVQDIAAIGSACRERGVLFHCDAAQSISRIPVNVDALQVDLLTLSAHKMYGPKGVGALYIRKTTPRIRLAPLLDGGDQENGVRSGTLNVPGIVGFGVSALIARELLPSEPGRIAGLRDAVQRRLEALPGGAIVRGDQASRLPDNLSVTFPGISAAALIRELRGVALSTGSACSSGSGEPSHVLEAIGLEKADAASTLRLSFGRPTTEGEAEIVATLFETVVASLRSSLPGAV